MFKILVVEDDKDLNKTVCSFLNHSGYEAIGCLNANDAYEVLADNIIDLIVSDIMMPGIDGFEFASNVRELNEDIPILFMTAKDDIASKQRGCAEWKIIESFWLIMEKAGWFAPYCRANHLRYFASYSF